MPVFIVSLQKRWGFVICFNPEQFCRCRIAKQKPAVAVVDKMLLLYAVVTVCIVLYLPLGCTMCIAVLLVEQFRHLGHILSNSLNDDDDIKREIQSLYICTNMVISRFHRCSTRVKRILFKSYCLCFYDMALWKHYSVTVLSKFKSC